MNRTIILIAVTIALILVGCDVPVGGDLDVGYKGERHDLTVGSDNATQYNLGAITSRSGHGNRIYCSVSHFAWDDPIVYPGESGRAHLHMFWGNVQANAGSTGELLASRGASSCEGGANYRTSGWIPAVFNDKGEVVVPETVFIYYKSFGGPDMRYDLLQIVPQGLEMLASADTKNYRDAASSQWTTRHEIKMLNLSIVFPSCVATIDGTRTGRPILRYQDMPGEDAWTVNSHVAYPGGPDKNEVGCPASHPYRFATPSFHLYFSAAETGPSPYLSSDGDATPLSTLHADYMFGVAPEVNEKILQCVVDGRSCGFDGGRGQLAERFYSPLGERVYRNSVRLEDEADRTPFADTLTPMQEEMTHSM